MVLGGVSEVLRAGCGDGEAVHLANQGMITL